jgi:hypothetical protein
MENLDVAFVPRVDEWRGGNSVELEGQGDEAGGVREERWELGTESCGLCVVSCERKKEMQVVAGKKLRTQRTKKT